MAGFNGGFGVFSHPGLRWCLMLDVPCLRWAARMRYSSRDHSLVMTPLGSALLSGRHGPEDMRIALPHPATK
eukprot:5001814-Amphidinium_carterae.2